MSFSQLDRITLAAKALAGGVLDADPTAQWYESTLPFSFAMPADKVWTQSDLIKANPAANVATAQANAAGPLLGIIDDLSANASSIRLTPVPGVNNTFVALSTYGDFSSALLDNWLAPVFAPQASGLPSVGYAVRLYDGNPATGGIEVLTTDGTTGTGVDKSVAWMFNYAGGILLLSSDFSIADPHIVGFRYVGSKASAPLVGSSRRSYGTCTLTKANTSSLFPTNSGLLISESEIGGGHTQLVKNFDSNYSKSTVRLRVFPFGSNIASIDIEQVFPDLASIATWVNANVPNNGVLFTSTCTMEVYDIIDPNLVPPAKVYGKNRVWASLVAEAPGGYYHRPKTASSFYAFNSINSLNLANLLNGLWTSFYGATMPATASWTAPEFGCFWVGRNRHRKYSMPSLLNGQLLLDNNQDRYERDIVALSTVTPPLVGQRSYDIAVGHVTYASLDAFGNYAGIFDPTVAFTELALRIMNGHSVVVGYPVKPGVGNTRAVYLKPVGMDHFFLDSFDVSKYRVEAVGVQGQATHPRITPMSVVTVPSQRSSSPIDGRHFGPMMGYTAEKSRAFPGRHSYRLGSVKFQYRDLATGYVSPVSTATISTIWRRRLIPFGLTVRNHVDR